MSRYSRSAMLAMLSILWCGVSASAETMRCQSINGNLNCAGSGGVSCQTINGKKVCVSGKGDVVQSFGGRTSSDDGDTQDKGSDGDEDLSPMKQRLEQHGSRGRTLLLERQGSRLHVHNDWLSYDRD
jgi:hypothetical protein